MQAQLTKRTKDLSKLNKDMCQARRIKIERIQRYLFPIQVQPVFPVMGTPPTQDAVEMMRGEIKFLHFMLCVCVCVWGGVGWGGVCVCVCGGGGGGGGGVGGLGGSLFQSFLGGRVVCLHKEDVI